MAAGIPIFQWLGVCGLHQVITSTTGWLFLSQVRGGDFFKLGLFNAVATVISFVIGLPWGPLGVAISYTICNYLVLVLATCGVQAGAGRSAPAISCRPPFRTRLPQFSAVRS